MVSCLLKCDECTNRCTNGCTNGGTNGLMDVLMDVLMWQSYHTGLYTQLDNG